MEKTEGMGTGHEMEPEPKGRYFEKSLSNFIHDVAGGDAIRHLVDQGYSISQIQERMDYPFPQKRLEDAVWKYMLDSRLILQGSPGEETGAKRISFCERNRTRLYQKLRGLFSRYGEEKVYIFCPYGRWLGRDRGQGVIFQCPGLTSREIDYVCGIPWQGEDLYHRLNSRMLEIAVELAAFGEELTVLVCC